VCIEEGPKPTGKELYQCNPKNLLILLIEYSIIRCNLAKVFHSLLSNVLAM